jgi:hypothetical protein
MQGFERMGKKGIHRLGLGVLLIGIFIVAGVLTASAVVESTDANRQSPGHADVISIDGLKAFGPLERPAVHFFHDKHTEALAKQGKDCLACHSQDKDKLSIKFKRTEDTDKQTVMDIYHDQCIGCHKQGTAETKTSGPVTCGRCHVENAAVNSIWQPIGLDLAMHYRHVKANQKKCETCHHEYNAQTKMLVYAKGKEGACVYCHKAVTEENRIANRQASHMACVSCHRKLTAQDKDAGPIQCAGCHDPAQQALFERPADIPRMERNQPDLLLVKIAPKDKPVPETAGRMPPVPFNHKAHEQYNSSCKVCHHAGLQGCAECHTIGGDEAGKQVRLTQAMHQRDAHGSCVGCHAKQQAKPECAGCHSSDAAIRTLADEASCRTCHMRPATDNPYPADLEAANAVAEEMLAMRQSVSNTALPLDQIPETVTIKMLTDQYEPVVLPHRKIVVTLSRITESNRLAGFFHADATTVCQGCHHNSPASQKPPQCGSCHGRTSEPLNLSRPGLMAAYHQQCIQCHDKMGLEKPVSRQCTDCHAKRK